MKVDISKSFGDKVVLNHFEAEFPQNKIIGLTGVSGSGKTTILNAISGNIEYEGHIEDGPQRVSYIFQEPRLIPSMTVFENLDFVLKGIIADKKEREVLIKDSLKSVEMQSEANAYPKSLSGGMAQRIALARGFLFPSDLLLMDEPWKALDLRLELKMMELFKNLYEKSPRTVIMVTHDFDEAIDLCDKIIVLKDGVNAYETDIEKGPSQEKRGQIKEKLTTFFM